VIFGGEGRPADPKVLKIKGMVALLNRSLSSLESSPTALRASEEMSEKTLATRVNRPRGRPFKKGNLGRPLGSRNRQTLALEAILEGEAELILNKVVGMALKGNWNALKLCVDRILPVRHDRSISFDIPPLNSASDGASALAAVVAAIASGNMTANEGLSVAQVIGIACRGLEARDVEKRIELLEGQQEGK
jgi:hypothetical protein